MSGVDAVRAFEAAFTANDADGLRATATGDYVDHWPMPGTEPGIEGTIAFRAGVADAFPDMDQVIDEVIESGDTLASRWHVTGTHKGEFMGIPATGNKVEMNGMSFYKLRDGKVAEIWNMPDIATLMEQLGALG
jgi:steroid delta-isomerase-like uncharacterized protein